MGLLWLAVLQCPWISSCSRGTAAGILERAAGSLCRCTGLLCGLLRDYGGVAPLLSLGDCYIDSISYLAVASSCCRPLRERARGTLTVLAVCGTRALWLPRLFCGWQVLFGYLLFVCVDFLVLSLAKLLGLCDTVGTVWCSGLSGLGAWSWPMGRGMWPPSPAESSTLSCDCCSQLCRVCDFYRVNSPVEGPGMSGETGCNGRHLGQGHVAPLVLPLLAGAYCCTQRYVCLWKFHLLWYCPFLFATCSYHADGAALH